MLLCSEYHNGYSLQVVVECYSFLQFFYKFILQDWSCMLLELCWLLFFRLYFPSWDCYFLVMEWTGWLYILSWKMNMEYFLIVLIEWSNVWNFSWCSEMDLQVRESLLGFHDVHSQLTYWSADPKNCFSHFPPLPRCFSYQDIKRGKLCGFKFCLINWLGHSLLLDDIRHKLFLCDLFMLILLYPVKLPNFHSSYCKYEFHVTMPNA